MIDAEDHTERGLQVAGERARIHRVSTVLNLEGLDAENQMRRAAAFLGGLFEVSRDHWYPMLVVVDEAQLFAPAVAGEVSDEARKLSLGAMTNLMCRGRKRGLAGVIATQRLAKLAKNVAAEASNFFMGRTFLDIDMARAADLLGMERRQAEAFRDLERGHFMALGPALSRRPLGLRIGPTDTRPRNATPRLMPLPESSLEDARAIILAAPPPENIRPQRRPPSPDLLNQLMAAKSAALEVAPEPEEQPPSAEQVAERRERLDRILSAILTEPDAGFRAISVLYQEFVVRCRIEGLGSSVPDLNHFRRMLAHARAGLGADMAEDDAWQDVSLRAAILPQDMQGVFMMIARAAKEGWPCPSDAAIARAYGTHLAAPRTRSADLYRGPGPHRLPDGRDRPAHRDARRTGLGHGTGRSQCRRIAGGRKLQQLASMRRRPSPRGDNVSYRALPIRHVGEVPATSRHCGSISSREAVQSPPKALKFMRRAVRETQTRAVRKIGHCPETRTSLALDCVSIPLQSWRVERFQKPSKCSTAESTTPPSFAPLTNRPSAATYESPCCRPPVASPADCQPANRAYRPDCEKDWCGHKHVSPSRARPAWLRHPDPHQDR